MEFPGCAEETSYETQPFTDIISEISIDMNRECACFTHSHTGEHNFYTVNEIAGPNVSFIEVPL